VREADAWLERLLELTTSLGDGEMEVLCQVAEGLVAGQKQYGGLNPDDPSRDWLQECAEECRDGLNYLGAQLIRVNRMRAKREG